MSYKIEDVEGIGASYGEKLREAGLQSTGDFLEKCKTPQGRKTVAESTGISDKLILRWANLSDLMRISGIGPQFSELLEAAGVDTVKELKHRNAENLAEAMEKINGEKKLARTSPAAKTVAEWIEQAKSMEPGIEY
jgi:predicted flap endonuclease-1-like 5' DNA nuclease